MGDFSFPKLKEADLPLQNPLLAKATVTDRSDRTSTASTRPLNNAESNQAKEMPPPPRGRSKIPLEKGYSQVDWLRLTRTHKDLAGLNGGMLRKNIPMEEVQQHNTVDDAWTVFRGKVYNITPYMKFHPGGVPQLKRAAGIDCTTLFMKYHAWVNADALLEKCLIGLVEKKAAQ